MARLAACSLALVGLFLSACGGSGGAQAQGAQVRSLAGVDVFIESDAPFTAAADLDARMQTTIEAALQFWGGTWSMLDHLDIHVLDTPLVSCGGGQSLGCYEGHEIRFTTRDPGLGTVDCVEQTVLVHEIGHAVLGGDYDHTDPRWMDMDLLAKKLSGRAGYGPDGAAAACDIYPSVWEHPLGTP